MHHVQLGCILVLVYNGCLSAGYNIETSGKVEKFGEPSRQNDSLFGWTIAYFKDNLFISAPRALNKDQPDGDVYKCQVGRGCDKLRRENDRGEKDRNAWFGGSLVASSDQLFACAPRTGQPLQVNTRTHMGSCFKLNTAGNKFELHQSFHKNKNYNFGSGKLFLGTGIYGFSAVQDQNGNLRVGGPQNPQIYISQFSRQDIRLYSGVVTEIRNRQIWFPDSRRPPPYSYDGQDTWAEYPNYIMAGYFVGKGRFSESKGELIVGAPGANYHRGAVYVCASCINSFGFSGHDQEVGGDQGGEGFGQTALACDINGDGKDDLLVGAPLFSPSNKFYDTGKVYVYTNFWNRNSRLKFNLVKTNVLGVDNIRQVSGSMFGKSLACLGDTDGDGKEEVVVGAPYYTNDQGLMTGAVFVFKSINKQNSLDSVPTQIIFGKSSSFGFSMAVPHMEKDTISFGNRNSRKVELSISSPTSRAVYIYKFRNVFRFNDTSTYKLYCYDANNDQKLCNTNIDTQTKKMVLEITPRISNQNNQADIKVTAKIVVGALITEESGAAEGYGSILQGNLDSQPIKFTFLPQAWGESLNEQSEHSVKIQYQLQYSMICTGQLCPMFPQMPDSRKDREALDEQSVLFSHFIEPTLSACKSAICDCEMEYVLTDFKQTIVSGGMTSVVVGQLSITNNGRELSHSNKIVISVRGDNSTRIITDKIPAICNIDAARVSCNLRSILDPGKSEKIQLEIRPTDFIEGNQLLIEVETSSVCSRDTTIKQLSVKLEQKWTVSATPDAKHGKHIVWREQDPENVKEKHRMLKHIFTVKNDGPSLNTPTEAYLFIASNNLVSEATIRMGGQLCTQEGDPQYNMIPPQPQPAPSGDNIERIYCMTRANCLCIRCALPRINPRSDLEITVERNFSLSDAENFEKNIFYFATGIITLDNRGKEHGAIGIATYEFSAVTVIEQVLNHYDIIIAVVLGLVLLVVINVVFKYFDVFNKVRCYKNLQPTEVPLDDFDNVPLETEGKVTLRQ